ncbi:TadE/TadG family type IV pilus assembly protein [Bosea sp. 2RAB26]|uniref:TadE/TadG family type IV pilus assembly protein n=1 Tax=Bosea sp. 2RAB26 TaxID=3237476 RepID=UPI003F8EA23E
MAPPFPLGASRRIALAQDVWSSRYRMYQAMTIHVTVRDSIRSRRERQRPWHVIKRFRSDEAGVTAVEFGFIGIPFLMLMFAILETALMFWTSQILEEAVSQTSRQLLTGEALTRYSGSAAAKTEAFKRDLCNNAPGLMNCDNLTIDVRTYTSFATARTGTTGSNPVKGGALDTSGFGYADPQPSQILVVRAVLEYPVLVSSWNSALVNLGTDRRALIATTTFRTEPFLGLKS